MATEIRGRDAARTPVLSIHKQSDGCALFGCVSTGQSHLYTRGSLRIEDVDAAFREELGLRIVPADAIVIERSDVDAVAVGGSIATLTAGTLTVDTDGLSADDARAAAIEWLAIAEHLDAHPPVDEAKVEALAEIVKSEVLTRPKETGEFADWQTIARRLLATGRIEVTP